MGKRELRWTAELPAKAFVPIMTVRGGRELVVRAAGPVIGLYAHFFDGRSSPCWGAPDAPPCPGCKSQKARWKGFLPAYLPTGARRILEITEGAMRGCSFLSHSRLPGSWLVLRRTGTAPNSPLLVWPDLTRERVPETQPFDVAPSVEHMWGLDKPPIGPDADYAQG